MIGVALVVRIIGIIVDGTLRESLGLVGAETILMVLCITGFFIESRRLRR
jgi:hypothetical protein